MNNLIDLLIDYSSIPPFKDSPITSVLWQSHRGRSNVQGTGVAMRPASERGAERIAAMHHTHSSVIDSSGTGSTEAALLKQAADSGK